MWDLTSNWSLQL